ncbi:hypothetical protein [Devosia sp. DBB001]|nr:hypothetical protein [Devosia sp. DBB001]
MPMPNRRCSSVVLGLCVFLASAVHGIGADRPAASDVWRIALGQPVAAIPDSFADFACGSNGGPPKLPLEGFEDYGSCPAENSGLHEVYFRYDDELEYWAKANNVPLLVAASGTKVYDLPVIISALIDNTGIVEGLRLVSDPRDTSVPRENARFLAPFLKARFRAPGSEWACENLPVEAGETPVYGEFVKEDCALSRDGNQYSLNTRYLRKAGEKAIDPHTGKPTEGQFESHVWFEMRQG